jgi:hypothetical protein
MLKSLFLQNKSLLLKIFSLLIRVGISREVAAAQQFIATEAGPATLKAQNSL